MTFSRKQQQVLGVFCLLYGIWLIWAIYADSQRTVEFSYLAEPDSHSIPFYLDPPVDLNSATPQELQLLPVIGPILARRIVAYREEHGSFRTLGSLQNIYGFGPKRTQTLQYYFELKIEK